MHTLAVLDISGIRNNDPISNELQSIKSNEIVSGSADKLMATNSYTT